MPVTYDEYKTIYRVKYGGTAGDCYVTIGANGEVYYEKPAETEDQKAKRLAKEKKLAEWDEYDQAGD